MTLQDLGALGELVGGIAIIVSLIYVGLQIKQGAQASRAATIQSFSTQYAELILQITREDFRDIFWRGVGGLQNLRESETAAFMAFLASIVRMFESFYFQKMDGSFDDRLFDSWMTQTLDLFGTEGGREYWAFRKHQFNAEFVEFFDQQMATFTPRPMYPDTHLYKPE